MRNGSASEAWRNPVRIRRPEIDKLACQAESARILAKGEIPANRRDPKVTTTFFPTLHKCLSVNIASIPEVCYNKIRKAGGYIMRKSKSDPMPLKLAVFMLVIGVLLGSVFVFGMQYWNKSIPREDCTVIETQFISYDEIWHYKPTARIIEIAIDCANGNRYFIDGVSINKELQNKLSSLSKNENITLLIHPNSSTIVEFSNADNILLSFDETITKLGGEASGFFFVGLFMYFCALVGAYYVVYHIVRRRK